MVSGGFRGTVLPFNVKNGLLCPGHLSARVLEILRMSEIEALDLTASLMEAEGLNLGARDLLPGKMMRSKHICVPVDF